MKILDGQVALGNKSNTKALGEHKVSAIPSICPELIRQFWKTQPVPQLPSADTPVLIEEGPIDGLKRPSEVKQEPGSLPSGFQWSSIDIKNEEQVSNLSQWIPLLPG